MAEENLDFPKIFAEVSCGNQHAYDFCGAFLRWVHLIDDFIDGDKPLEDPEFVIRVNLEAMMTFAFNPFWQEHKAALMPLVIQGAKAYADSIRWAKRENFRDRATSDVLKAQYQEVFWFVAKICGGYDHYDQVTQKYRDYHYDIAA